ncbi:tetratricopeptide repeat protein [Terrihabitans sp. B22-R8]|uniref:tetratricopeptide repeat protein n=1 Tax=Terrihabitans sp. B22-R8 TaxID=3425128 RepID=UPI00403C538A
MKFRICLAVSTALVTGALAAAPVFARESADAGLPEPGPSIMGNYLSGRSAAADRDIRSAAIYLRAALKADPGNPELLDRTMRLSLASGDVEGAFPLAERIVTMDPTNRWARLALAAQAIKKRHYVTARTQLGKVPRNSVPDVIGIITSAWAWQGSKEPARALRTLDGLTGSELSQLFRDLHGGLIAEASGRFEEADRRLAAAYRTDQSMYVIVDAYARSLARAGKRDDALAVYRALSEQTPRNALLNASIKALEENRKLPPVATSPADGIAEILFVFGQLANRDAVELSLIYLNLALYLKPEHELALLTLADVQENLGQHTEAIRLYEVLPKSSGFSEDVDLKIAANLAQDNREAEAETRLRTLIAEDPKDRDAIVALANLLHRKKDYPAAAETFSKAVALIEGEAKKSDWALFFARGVAYDAGKDFPRAEADLVKSNELDPEQPVVLNYLGYSWVDRGMHIDKGLELIKKAVDLRPNDGDIIDSLGWAYYRLGKYAEATTELERAVEQKPQSWEINDHLGDVYWKTDRKLEARFQWLHALSLDIEDEKRGPIERKLKEGLEPVEAEIAAQRAAERGEPVPPPSPAPASPPENPVGTEKDSRADVPTPGEPATGRN